MLRTWAVPKGLPTDPRTNRLAVAVPDHDMEHLTYTDADKSIADTGWWEEVDRRHDLSRGGGTGSVRCSGCPSASTALVYGPWSPHVPRRRPHRPRYYRAIFSRQPGGGGWARGLVDALLR